MSGFITFLVVFVAIVLIILVLLQRSKAGGGLGAVAGGQSEAMFGANAGNVLGKTTAWLIGIFFALTLTLTLIRPTSDEAKSKMTAADNEAPVMEAPATEATDVSAVKAVATEAADKTLEVPADIPAPPPTPVVPAPPVAPAVAPDSE